jgi:hypothetical protein
MCHTSNGIHDVVMKATTATPIIKSPVAAAYIIYVIT